MTPEDIRERVRAISQAIDDDERAHSMEDALHRDVLQAIASKECEDPVACAEAALETLELEFARWRA